MFNLKRHDRSAAHVDLSQNLEEDHHWNVVVLASFEYLHDVTSFAIEPISGLLAIGIALFLPCAIINVHP